MDLDNQEFITSDESLASGYASDDVEPVVGTEADSDVAGQQPANDDSVITLAEIEQTLGKKFPTKAAALKSWHDTNRMVGSVGQKKEEPSKPQAQSDTSDLTAAVAELQKQLKETSFYAERPELKAHKDIISSLGPDPEVVIQSEAWKKIGSALTRSESENTQSILHSNARITASASPADYQREMDKAIKDGKLGDFLSKHKGVEMPQE